MKSTTTRRALVLAGAAAGGLTLASTSARADSITATLDNVSPSRIVGINYNNAFLGNAYAGALNWHGTASNPAGLTGNFDTFCIDLTQDVYLGQTYSYAVGSLASSPNPTPPTAPVGTGMGSLNAQRVEKLYALQYDSIGSDNDRGAAFQIALWEMLFDTSAGDVGTGMFNVTNASVDVTNLANQFVVSAMSPGAMSFHHELLALTSPTFQDQIFLGSPSHEPGPPGTAVPTPAAAFGAIPLLGALAFRQHRKRRDAL